MVKQKYLFQGNLQKRIASLEDFLLPEVFYLLAGKSEDKKYKSEFSFLTSYFLLLTSYLIPLTSYFSTNV